MPGPVDVNLARPHVTVPPGSRLGLPGALIFVIGCGMIYVALRGWDKKYQLLGGRLTGDTPSKSDTPAQPEEPMIVVPDIPGGPIA